LDPEDIKILSLGAIWNFGKGTGHSWAEVRLWGTKGLSIRPGCIRTVRVQTQCKSSSSWCMGVEFPRHRNCNQSAPATRPLLLFHHHSSNITHSASSHAAVNIMQYRKYQKPFPSHYANKAV
jgi:hypothetical protein